MTANCHVDLQGVAIIFTYVLVISVVGLSVGAAKESWFEVPWKSGY